jgi:hypothetical protein
MGEKHLKAAQAKPEDSLFECERPATVRKLDEQVAPGLGKREADALLVGQALELLQIDLASVKDRKWNPLLGEVSANSATPRSIRSALVG